MGNSKDKLIVIGGGGHAKVVIDAMRKDGGYSISGIIDPKLEKGSTFCGIAVLGSDDILADIYKQGINYAFIAVGSIGNCETREKIYNNLESIGYDLPIVVHPAAIVAQDVEIGKGTFIAAGAVVNPGTKIGKNVIINTSASVDHDCIIGDFVHIAPGVTLSAKIRVGDETHIGTGSNVIQGIKIGKGCIIGAGRTIRNDKTDKFRDVDKRDGYAKE